MKAIVLGAGYATRLHPLTRDRAKPLLEVGGRPILSHIVDRLCELDDLSEIVVVSNHRFAAQYAEWQAGCAADVPIRVLDDGSTCEDDRLGAIGDIAFALEQAPLCDEDWLVIAGDNLVDASFQDLQREFLRRRRPLLVVRDAPIGGGASRYNEVTVGADDRVVRFREKPADPRTGVAAIALYLLPAEVAPLVAEYLATGGEPDAPGYWLEWLVGRTRVHCTRLRGEWIDIGDLQTLEAARARFATR